MKLFELIPNLKHFTIIKREDWDYFLVKSLHNNSPLIKLDMNLLQIEKYALTYEDLIADDWMVIP